MGVQGIGHLSINGGGIAAHSPSQMDIPVAVPSEGSPPFENGRNRHILGDDAARTLDRRAPLRKGRSFRRLASTTSIAIQK